jgi:hypothetical protein
MKKRSIQQTASAAVLAVGAELSRRGYDVAFTMGNTRRVDALCSVPDGKAFKVQVKGISNRSGFYIDESFFNRNDPDLFLVVVFVPKIGDESPMQFCVLSYAEANAEFAKRPKDKKDGKRYEGGSGLVWGSVKNYSGAWSTFPPLS